MTIDADTKKMVQASSRKFVERYRTSIASLEGTQGNAIDRDVLDAVANMGWLSRWMDPDGSSDSVDTAQILAAIVEQLGADTPALAARLLSHHFCLACIDERHSVEIAAHQQENAQWLGLEGSTAAGRFAPTLNLDDQLGAPALGGWTRFVVGGDVARYWVATARCTDGERSLVLIDGASVIGRHAVKTLGLTGLGVTDAQLSGATGGATLLAKGEAIGESLARARHAIGPGYLALMTALLERTRCVAVDYARTRRQNGTALEAIPAVRLHLDCIERALTTSRAANRWCHDETTAAVPLWREVRDAALQATDAGLQILGGSGYIVGTGAERPWRDVRQLAQLFLQDDW